MEPHIISLDKTRSQEYKDLRIFAVQESPEAFSTTVEEEKNKSEDWWMDRLQDDYSKTNRKMLFAEVDGKLVGMVGMHFHALEKAKHIGEIVSVYVLPEYRSKGIARKLLEGIIQFGQEKAHIRKVALEVTITQEAAAKLYESLGFRTVGILKDEIKIGDRYLDHIYMEKLLY